MTGKYVTIISGSLYNIEYISRLVLNVECLVFNNSLCLTSDSCIYST